MREFETEDAMLQAARDAQRLLNDPGIADAFKSIKEDTVKRWITSETQHEREKCWYHIQAIEDVHRDLRALIGDMQIVEARDEEKK